MPEIALIHLVWEPAGLEPLNRFIRAYSAYESGVEHDLVVAFNGFSGKDLSIHERTLQGVAHTSILVPSRMQDIPAYAWVARRLAQHRVVCFVNSYSEPLQEGWLKMLHEALVARGAGAVAATGSWESMYTNYLLAIRVQSHAVMSRLKQPLRRFRMARYRRSFAPMPNPHIRSNAFMLQRTKWLELSSRPITSKEHAWRFESGRRSLTNRLGEDGLQVFVVGRDGVAYGKDDWPRSRTFRSGGQTNLLVADNRTRQYANATHEEKVKLNTLSWGLGTAPL